MKTVEATRFLEDHPGLRDALSADHPITRDLLEQLRIKGSLSDKQVALAMKLVNEVGDGKHVPAPIGKATFEGLVISLKTHTTEFGEVWRATIQVKTTQGVWLAWGTAPAACLSEAGPHGGLLHCMVQIKCTLEASREPHFAFMKRPRGKVIRFACEPKTCLQCQRDKDDSVQQELPGVCSSTLDHRPSTID